MKRSLNSLLLGVPAALLLGLGAAHFRESTGAENVDLVGVVAVVDVERVEQALPLHAQLERELEKLIGEIQASSKTELDAVKVAEDRVQQAEKGTRTRDKLIIELEMARHLYELNGKLAESTIKQRQVEMIQEIRTELRSKIEAYASKKGFQMVLRYRSASAGRQQMDANFVEDLVYHLPRLDITEDLIQFVK